MDKVSIIIPTYDRAELLKRTVETILEGDYKAIHIFIIIDGNKKYCMDFIDFSNPFVSILRNEKRMDWVYSMNWGLRETGDANAVIYASDDVEFPSYAISKAMRALKRHFPDGDGLVGLSQGEGMPQASFGLMGRKFIERFPNNQVFCPDYIHYASDWELREFARSIDKFYFCEDVVIKHNRSMDKTMKLGLEVLDIDQAAKKERVKRNLLWGKAFDRIEGWLHRGTMKISILIPTLDNAEYMKIIIPAIRKHTANPYEILVYANDMSPKMKEYASKESFDVFEYSHRNEGIALAVNVLAKRAAGDIVFYLNDDMYVAPNWDRALIRKVNDDIFYQYLTPCMFEPRWENPTMNTPFDYGRTPETWQEQKFLSEWWDLRQIKEDIISQSIPTFMKKELWDRVGGYDEKYWPGFGTDPDLGAKIYFSAKEENKPYEFRGVSDSGIYHFQCISTERIQNRDSCRRKAHQRFEQKWGFTAKQFNEIVGVGKRL